MVSDTTSHKEMQKGGKNSTLLTNNLSSDDDMRNRVITMMI